MRLRWITAHGVLVLTLAATGGACHFTSASQGGRPAANEVLRRPALGSPGPKLYPVDEGGQDEGFREFRAKLLDALKRRDADFILAILDPHVLNSLGGNGGIEEFKEQWRPEEKDSDLWPTLTAVLEMGGSFEAAGGGKVFCAPYVSSRWRSVISQLPNDAEPLEYQAIIRENVAVRSAPRPAAAVVAALSYDVVRVDDAEAANDSNAAGGWVKVTTAGNQKGYIQSKDVRGPGDYRACFRRKGTDWIMTVFAAGD